MNKEIIAIQQIAQLIYLIRGQRVMLSQDLAILYGLAVKVLNQAVKRNATRFPADFLLQRKAEELANLKLQFVTPSRGGPRRARSYAFTGQGVAMLSSLWTGERTRLACWRWRPRPREFFQPLLDKFEIELKESFSARRRKEHARRVCSPD